jgi:hypothetical protein
MVEQITMNVDETLELDYLVEQIIDDEANITTQPSNVSTSIDYIKKQSAIFNPPDTGTYKIDINSQTIEIEVTDIPDSEADQKLRHRWTYDEGSGTAIADSIGSANGSINGASWVTGDWAGNTALDGDGSNDDVETTTLGTFGSEIDQDFAIALSVQTSNSTEGRFGSVDADGIHRVIFYLSRGGNGEFGLGVTDEGDNTLRIISDGVNIADGNKHRLVANKVGNSGTSGVKLYMDGTEITSKTADADQGFGNGSLDNFENPFYHFQENGGFSSSYYEGRKDDICIFDDSLTDSEATSYNPPWS